MNKLSLITGILSSVIYFVGTSLYMYGIIIGEVRPERTSWIIWLLVAVTLVLNSSGQKIIYFYITQAICCFIIVLLSLRKDVGIGGWSRLDKVSLFICVLAIGLRQILKQGLISILLASIVEGTAFMLTYLKLLKKPGTEMVAQWIASAITGFLAFVSTIGGSVIALIYPLILTIGNLAVVLLIYRTGSNSHATEND